ncbi:MAG: BlaI/MecI/CopY family transcriptional regulator [Oscillospiraceae bacterium]|nr:BlaI/MecI/CopY family transcriptional regulator [Oscillospiraceae bacterium]
MAELQLGEMETKFADIVWTNAPIATVELVKRCEQALSWKRTTTYTVLKRLCEKGLFDTANGTVSVVISREEFFARQSRQYVDTAFRGSLPAFLAAFTGGRRLTAAEAAELRALIAQAEEDAP